MRPFVFSLLTHGLLALVVFWGPVFSRPLDLPDRIRPVSLVEIAPVPPAPPVRTPNPESPRPRPAPPRSRPVTPPLPAPDPVPVPAPGPSLAERIRERLPGDVSRPRPVTPPPRQPTLPAPEPDPPAHQPEPAHPPETVEDPVTVDASPGFTDDWYLALLVRRLSEGWNLAREETVSIAPLSRAVQVRFVIRENGLIENVVVFRSSGNLVFDRAAGEVVRQISPMRPLPVSWGRDMLQVGVRFLEK